VPVVVPYAQRDVLPKSGSTTFFFTSIEIISGDGDGVIRNPFWGVDRIFVFAMGVKGKVDT